MSRASSATSSDALGRLVEDAGINASAPREQLWIDGWLVRYGPGKARRARCIQAVAAGTLPIDDKLERCLKVFSAAGLVPHVRITPWSLPAGLDDRLAALGWAAIDETRVMVASVAAPTAAAPSLPPGHEVEACDGASYAAWIGAARGSTAVERDGHARRLTQSPVPYCAFRVRDAGGEFVAGGQIACEGRVAGLYDVLTVEAARGRGIASALCAHLVDRAAEAGATTVYLQVDAGNTAAIAVYRRLGFADSYRYHYRTSPRRSDAPVAPTPASGI